MKAERWQQIENLFNAALEREEAERANFLAAVSADPEILKEVENLLTCHVKNTSFLETPPLKESVSLLATRQNLLSFNQKIGSYLILKLIGVGGMGEVYLAEDIRLKRQIALKVLSPEFVSIPNLISRFQQEARSASALNHPNILTIYEIGEENSIHYIAAEFIDGLTLRQIIVNQQITLGDFFEVSLQIVSALAAAHKAGIVHRDIKPQNIMRRPDGYVKVLDFGIAKLINKQFQTEKTDFLLNTATGAVIGTATYMSPEQARGLKVDHRSDIWSLGVTLYEMVTRQIPFKGQTTSDVIVSILERYPVSLIELAPIAPRELDAIIKRCLSKNIDLRYQSAEELGHDLRLLQEQIDLSGESRRLIDGSETDKKSLPANNSQRRNIINSFFTRKQFVGVKTKKDVSQIWLKFGEQRSVLSVFSVILLCFITGIVAVNYRPNVFEKAQSLWSGNPAKPSQPNKIPRRLSTAGKVKFASLSPDGKYAAYIGHEAGQESLWITQVAAGPPKMILPSSGSHYKGLTFSPNSDTVYFVIHDKSEKIAMGVLYAVSTLGGEPRKIIKDVDSPITFSPDGKNFVFVRGFTDESGKRAAALIIADLDGGNEKKIAPRKEPDSYSRDGLAWSPDGEIIIAAVIKTSDSAQKQMRLVEINLLDQSERPFTSRQWSQIGRVSWLGRHGKAIVMTAVEEQSGPAQLVQISYPESEVQTVTNDLDGYKDVSTTENGQGILAIASNRVSHIWTASANDLSQMKRLTPGAGRYFQTSWTPDNKIIYILDESGNQDIWIMDADGANTKPLTSGPAKDISPKVSFDNRYIVFASNRSGAFNIWRINRDGTNLLKLTNGFDDKHPEFSPDGKLIYYVTEIAGKKYLSKVATEGGTAERVFDFSVKGKALSPDGKQILCVYLDEQTNAEWKVGIALTNGKSIVQTLNISIKDSQISRWATNGQTITYTDGLDNLDNLWNYPITGADANVPKKLTALDSSNQIFYFDWSSDGKNLVCLRGNKTDDIVYFDNQIY